MGFPVAPLIALGSALFHAIGGRKQAKQAYQDAQPHMQQQSQSRAAMGALLKGISGAYNLPIDPGALQNFSTPLPIPKYNSAGQNWNLLGTAGDAWMGQRNTDAANPQTPYGDPNAGTGTNPFHVDPRQIQLNGTTGSPAPEEDLMSKLQIPGMEFFK